MKSTNNKIQISSIVHEGELHINLTDMMSWLHIISDEIRLKGRDYEVVNAIIMKMEEIVGEAIKQNNVEKPIEEVDNNNRTVYNNRTIGDL